MAIQDYYTTTAYYKAPTTSTGWGGENSFGSGTTFMCGVNPTKGMVRLAGGKETLFADAKLFCSDTVALVGKYRVVHAGTTYDVAFVKNTFGMTHHKLVYLVSRLD